jgi:hypothetical protein
VNLWKGAWQSTSSEAAGAHACWCCEIRPSDAERAAETKKVWESMNGQQGGDPVKLADALLKVADLDEPPLRFVAGDDCLQAVAAKAKELLAQVDASRGLGSGLAHTGTPMPWARPSTSPTASVWSAPATATSSASRGRDRQVPGR